MLWTAASEEGSWSPAVLPTAAWGSLWDLCASEMGILNFSAGKSCRVSQYKAKLEFIQKRLQHQFKPVLRKKEGHSRKDCTHPRHGSKLKSLARGPYQSLLPMATFCLVQRAPKGFLFIYLCSLCKWDQRLALEEPWAGVQAGKTKTEAKSINGILPRLGYRDWGHMFGCKQTSESCLRHSQKVTRFQLGKGGVWTERSHMLRHDSLLS